MNKIVPVLLIFLLLVACSGKPGDAQIENALNQKMTEFGLDKGFKIKNLKRTNGFEENKNTYIADVSYEIEYIKSGFTMPLYEKFVAFVNHLQTKVENPDKPGLNMITPTCHLHSKITMIKTDNGWMMKW